jgi:hypothetical protein
MVEPWPRGQGQALTALSSMRGAGSRYSPGEPPCHWGPHVLQDGPPNRDGRTSLLHCDPFDAVSNLMSSSLALCPSMRVTSALDKVRRACWFRRRTAVRHGSGVDGRSPVDRATPLNLNRCAFRQQPGTSRRWSSVGGSARTSKGVSDERGCHPIYLAHAEDHRQSVHGHRRRSGVP